MSFFAIPLSGLNASQSSLQAVSNNLANVNTDGYKDQNVTFNDVYAQSGVTNGAKDPIQTGNGVATASTTTNFTDGTAAQTGIASNLALTGDGFFVVRQTSGQVAYSRAGDFTTNNAGQLVAPDGSLVLGYQAVNGVIQTSAPLAPLAIGKGLINPATPTSTFSANVNLNSDAPVNTATAASPVGIYDSLGSAHNLQVSYTKTGTNQWSYSVTIPSADLAAPTATGSNTQQIASGGLTFDSNGKLAGVTDSNGKAVPAPYDVAVNIPAYADGASGQNITWNLSNTAGSPLLTQSNLASGTTNTVQNGSPAGALKDYSVQTDGTIQATFTAGPPQALGQVAVATVINTQGLDQIGNNLFQVTQGSGQAEIGIAGTGGRGIIKGGYVESSNVNIANEFSKLIVAQQAYQANAKTVTTFNQIEQATIAILQ